MNKQQPYRNKELEYIVISVYVAIFLYMVLFTHPSCLSVILVVGGMLIGGVLVFMVDMLLESVSRNLRPDIELVQIPEGQFIEQKTLFEPETAELAKLGFEKVSENFTNTSPETLMFIYEKKDEHTFVMVGKAAKQRIIDFFTLLRTDRGFTTSSFHIVASLPVPEKAFVQIFQNAPAESLLEEHRKGLRFLQEKGLEFRDITEEELRNLMNTETRKKVEDLRKLPFWAWRVLYWMLTKRGMKYALPIEEQYRRGMIKIDIPSPGSASDGEAG